LESVYRGNSIEGSNPSLSATFSSFSFYELRGRFALVGQYRAAWRNQTGFPVEILLDESEREDLSTEKSSVVFLREPNSSEKEIWAIRTDGSGLRPLFRGPVRWKNGTYPSSTLRSPQWSAEGKAVYFVTDFSSTTGALWRLDLTSGKTAVIIPDAVMYGVIQTGRYRGFLVANQRSLSRPEPDGSRYPVYPFFLYTPLGEKVRLVGEENGDDDLEPLLEDWEHR